MFKIVLLKITQILSVLLSASVIEITTLKVLVGTNLSLLAII